MATTKSTLSSKTNSELENTIVELLRLLDLTNNETSRAVIEQSIERVSEEIRSRASRSTHLSLVA